MLFKKKKCPHCELEFDEMLDFCPHCKKENEGIIEFRKKSKVTFIPFYLQLALVAISLVGFLIANIIFTLAFKSIYDVDKVKGMMLINVASYVLFFIGIGAVIFPYTKAFLIRFKGYWPYLIGLFGVIAIIGGQTIIQVITDSIYPTQPGGNQTIASQIVKSYPVVAVLILGIVGPICEEFGYRVGLFSFLRRVHPVLAYLGTAVVFGLIHFDFTSPDLINELLLFITYFWAGIVFSCAYDIGGIAASTTAHIASNLVSIILIITGVSQ